MKPRSDGGAFLGPAYSHADIETRLAKAGAHFTVVSDEDVTRHLPRPWRGRRLDAGPHRIWTARTVSVMANSDGK